MLSLNITFVYPTHIIIYGTGSFIVFMTLIALLRNLFCRSSKDDIYSDKSSKATRNSSRSFADYSRSKSNRSNYDYTTQNHKSSIGSIQSKHTDTAVLSSNPSTRKSSVPTASSIKHTMNSPPTPIQASPTSTCTPTSPVTMTMSPIPQFAPFSDQPSDTVSYDRKGSYDTDVDGQTDTELERINSSKKRKSISISINIPNFKLPRMPSISSRSTTILKNILRRMEYGQYDSKDIHLMIRSTSLFGCVGFLLSLLLLTTYYLTREAYGYIYFTYGALVLYGISKFIIYSLSLFRLYFALNNSVLQYSVYVYVMIIALLILHMIVFVAACGLLYVQRVFLSIYCAVLFFALDIIFICILYVLFTKRMFELFENTSTYIAESKAKVSYNMDHRDTLKKSKPSFDFVHSPRSSAGNTPRNGTYAANKSQNSNDRKASTNNLSIQIASNYKPRLHCDPNVVYPMHPISSISPVSTKSKSSVRVKSYSADVIELTTQSGTRKDSMDGNDSFTNTNRSLSNIVEETSSAKCEPSKTKRKREKWKHYQQQQASGIEYVTRYSVLVLLSSLSSLAMAGVLIYEQQYKLDTLFTTGIGMDDATELHVILCVDMIINCITIYFYFVFGRWLYQVSCCVCHAFVQRCCVSLCI